MLAELTPPRVWTRPALRPVGPTKAERRAIEGAARRAELEAAIVQKQVERHAMRRAARGEQRKLDDAAAKEEALLSERDAWRRREQHTAMALDLAKQEAEQRKKL